VATASAPGANDPGVNSLIDGVLGDSVGAPRAAAAVAAPPRAGVAAPPRPRQPIQWPPRPVTETEPPPRPAGLVARARTAMRGTTENTSAGLRTRTRVVIVLALTSAIVAAAVITTRALATTTSTNFAGVLAAETPIQLNFTAGGTLASIDVTPGQTVQVGQVLATEVSTVQAQDVHSDDLALAADLQHLGSLLGKAGAGAERQAAATYQKVQTLAAAQEARGAASVDSETSILQAAEQSQAAAQSQLAADQATYRTRCSGLGSGTCASLARDVQLDQTNVSAAEARVARAEAALSAAESIDHTLQALSTQEIALAGNEMPNVTLQLSDDITAARDAVAHDQAALAAAEAALQADTLVSAWAGKVATVSGVVGEQVGPAGSHSDSVTSSTGVPTSASTPSGPSTVTGLPAGTLPLITIDAAPGLEAIAQVPEVDITSIKPGETATVTVDALGGQSFTGRVAAIEQVPVDVQGSVYYDVVLVPQAGAFWSGELLPGMTANVSIG
jgi:multidrug efflux pump subunit AcrA (membrane-fusion protein)